jgi:nitrite transporter NirC
MFKDEFDAVCGQAEKKLAFLKRSPIGYFAASMLAGMFVAFGGFASAAVGGLLSAAGSGWTKIIAAAAFTAALSLVIMAGSELFTGNNMVMGAALFAKRVKISDAARLWIVCWIGNLAGSWLAVLLYRMTGQASGATADYIAALAATKLSLTVWKMIARGILCNMLVCLAVWCAAKLKSETAKLIMVFWCIFVFMICGFEHSVANMSLLGVALVDGTASFGGYVLNLIVVTLSNMVGGIFFVALPYYLASRKA